MIDPMTAMMLVNAGLSVGQTAFGAIQGAKAQKELKGLQRPEYQVNPEVYKSLGVAQSLASNRNLPGQGDIEAQMDASAANAVNQINRSGGSAADRMAAIAATYADNAQSKVGLGIQANQQYLQNLRGLQDQLMNVSAEKDKAFYDKQQGYYEKLQRLQQQAGAGTQNVAAGIQGLAGTANQAFSYQGQMDMLDKEHANEMARLAMLTGGMSEKSLPAQGLTNTPETTAALMAQGVNVGNMINPNQMNEFQKMQMMGLMPAQAGKYGLLIE